MTYGCINDQKKSNFKTQKIVKPDNIAVILFFYSQSVLFGRDFVVLNLVHIVCIETPEQISEA